MNHRNWYERLEAGARHYLNVLMVYIEAGRVPHPKIILSIEAGVGPFSIPRRLAWEKLGGRLNKDAQATKEGEFPKPNDDSRFAWFSPPWVVTRNWRQSRKLAC